MAVEALKTKAELGFADTFRQARNSLPGDGWAAKLRADAWAAYDAVGLPHRRVEEWKYTDLRAALKEAFPPAPMLGEALSREDVDGALGDLADLDCHRLVVVDGQFRAELSDVEALHGAAEAISMGEALASPPAWLKERLGCIALLPGNHPLVDLNTALMSGGVALRVAESRTLDKPVHIVHVHGAKEPSGIATRNVVAIGDKAEVTLLESYVARSDAPAQRNTVTELDVADGARVEHIKYQNEARETAHLTTWLTRLGAEARYRAFQFATGAALARNEIVVAFAGEGSSSHVNGAVLARGRQHNDTTMVIDHAVPGCESREFNKLVLDGEARGIVQCRVNVHPYAQKSDGHQMAQGLLLSEAAEFDSKPELEIFADDVVCGHGSTSGQVDEELMFYLRSRGIPEPQARALLIKAFAAEVIETIEHEGIRERFLHAADLWLGGGAGEAL